MDKESFSLVRETAAWMVFVAAIVIAFGVFVLRMETADEKEAIRHCLELAGIQQFEELQWFEPTKRDGQTVVRLQFREETIFGDRAERDYLFVIEEGLASVFSLDAPETVRRLGLVT